MVLTQCSDQVQDPAMPQPRADAIDDAAEMLEENSVSPEALNLAY